MITRSQKARLGVFVAVAIGLIIIMIALIIGSQFFERRDIYYVAYEDISVSGLNVGSAVQFHGIQIGRVEDIRIDPENISRIIVTLSVEKDTPIKSDMKATISTPGITGMKMIELVGGSPAAPELKPGSFIPAGESMIAEITGRADVITAKLEHILNMTAELLTEENISDLLVLAENAKISLENVNLLLEENRDEIEQLSENLVAISTDARSAIGDIANLLDSEEFQNIITNLDTISTQAVAALDELNQAVTHIDLTVVEGREELLRSITLLKETIQYLNEFTRLISEDPSLIIRGRKFEEQRP